MLRMSARSPTNPRRHAFIFPDYLSWRNRPGVEAFQKLQGSDDPSLDRLGVVGMEMSQVNKDCAIQEERQRAVFGGW